MIKQKTADRIIATLVDHSPTPLTDNEIACILSLPAPSVRRTRSQLEDSGMIFYAGPRGKAATFAPASFLLESRAESTL